MSAALWKPEEIECARPTASGALSKAPPRTRLPDPERPSCRGSRGGPGSESPPGTQIQLRLTLVGARELGLLFVSRRLLGAPAGGWWFGVMLCLYLHFMFLEAVAKQSAAAWHQTV